MIQRIIDRYTEEYMLLDNDDKRTELGEIREAEEHVANIYFVILLITVCIAGFFGWLLFIGNGQMYEVPFVTQKLIAALLFFPVIIFIEVAWVRSSVSVLPMIFLLATSVAATLSSKLVLIYLLLYSIYFISAELRLISMKLLPGYPAFRDIEDSGFSKRMTYEQLVAYDKKQREDHKPLAADGEELDKLLRGELDLDGYLGVVKYDGAEEMDELMIPENIDLEGSDDTEKDR